MRFPWDEYIYNLFEGNQDKINGVNDAIWTSNLWIELDRNVIPPEDVFFKMRNHNINYWEDVVLALKKARGCFNRTDYAIPWITSLKEKGYKIYYLSNYSEFNMATAPEVLDFLPLMDGGVFSCDVKLLKPERAIFELLCSNYQLTPEECIFIDDRIENVEAATDFGMQAIQFKSYEITQASLQDILRKF